MLRSVVQMPDERVAFPYRYARLMECLLPLLDDVTDVHDGDADYGH